MQKIKKFMMSVAALAALAFGGAQIAGAASGSSSSEQSHGGDAAVTGAAAAKAKAAAIKAVGGGTAQDVRSENEGGAIYEVEVVNGGKTTEVLLDKSFAVVKQQADDKNGDGDGDGDNKDLTGAAAGKAKAAAIKAVGGGTAQDVRSENEGGAIYEVEVVNGGKTTEVLLDKAFAVVKQQADDAGRGDRDGDGN